MKTEHDVTIDVDVQTWSIQHVEAVRQDNNYDCGMLILKYVEHLWKDEAMQDSHRPIYLDSGERPHGCCWATRLPTRRRRRKMTKTN